MAALRSVLEDALNDLISNEEGMKFQSLAVVLAKKRWPDLIACERKRDFGADAIAKPAFAAEGEGKVLACSITAKLTKIRGDADKIRRHFSGIHKMIFATPVAVSNEMGEPWVAEIEKDFGLELAIVSREDILTSLLDPSNISLLRSHLGIQVEIEESVAELVERVRLAAREVSAGWLRRITERALIELRCLRLEADGQDSNELLLLGDICKALGESRRIVLEGSAGRGKTTTLTQIAMSQSTTGIPLLIDLSAWAASNTGILQFIAGMPQFQSRSLDPTMLARVSNVEHFSFLLNGWNEITEADSHHAESALRGLDRNFPGAGILVATRTHHLLPPLRGALRARLLTLTRAERIGYLDARLGSRADVLRKRFDTDPVLNDLTRTPLFLSQVTTLFEAGASIPSTKIGVLGAVMDLVEGSDEHRNRLQQPPLAGRARDYLGALATRMTMQGRVRLPEGEARSAVNSVGSALRNAGQIATVPDPGDVLNGLCAHHVLERQEYPVVAFRFEHQQFQEFYAALDARRQLSDLVQQWGEEKERQFIKTVINEPAWAESLGMIADEIGNASDGAEQADVLRKGKALVSMALSVDPVFASELARLAGRQVWQAVGRDVGSRLRSLYAVPDSRYRHVAMAGMLASGSEDFRDILVPILSSDDQQKRLRVYRTWGFHLSSLGSNWQEMVRNWQEEARADFVSELLHQRYLPELISFAASDRSVKVKEAAIRGLMWVGAEEEASRLLESLDVDVSEHVLQEFDLPLLPQTVRERALEAADRAFALSDDPWKRLGLLLRESALGVTKIAELKEELSRVSGKIEDRHARFIVKPALDIVQVADAAWVSAWIAERIAGETLWPDTWTKLITVVPEVLNEALVRRLETEDFKNAPYANIITVLAAGADGALARRVFLKLCELCTVTRKAPDERHEFEWAIERQLEDLLRALPVRVAVSGFSNCFSKAVDGVELDVITRVFSRVARLEADPLTTLDATTREQFRTYIKNAVPVALREADYTGELKANMTSLLASVGTKSDMREMRRLIQADIERFQTATALRARGDRSRAASATSYAIWHIRAIVRLDPRDWDSVLLDLLMEPVYERWVAEELARQVASPKNAQGFIRQVDYDEIWRARARAQEEIHNDSRHRYAKAIKDRIEALFAERNISEQKRPLEFRLRPLALALARIDSRGSSDVVFAVMSIPDDWDLWSRIEAFQVMLFNGVPLPTEQLLNLVESCRARFRKHGIQQQDESTVTRLLCLLPFVDDPNRGIELIRRLIPELPVRGHQLRDIVEAIGHCHCDAALPFLQELASDKVIAQQLGDAWIRAVAAVDTLEARNLLLSYLDPQSEEIVVEGDGGRNHVVVGQIVELAQRDRGIEQRLFQLCETELPPPKRMLLAQVLSQFASLEGISAGLKLIDDRANPPVPYEIRGQLEAAFVEKRPVAGSEGSYTLEPRSSNVIRAYLLEMALKDPRRQKSAAVLIAQIEEWRLEYGRPVGEPRHPALESGGTWPPIPEAGT